MYVRGAPAAVVTVNDCRGLSAVTGRRLPAGARCPPLFLSPALCPRPTRGSQAVVGWAPLDACFSVTGGGQGRAGLSKKTPAESSYLDQRLFPGCEASVTWRRRGGRPTF